MEVLYEDNHVIIVNKTAGEIVQGDKTGDRTLADEVKAYIKQKYNKPGEVFLGTVHRLDRPVSGLVVFARTSKALTRLNEMFRRGDVHKTYHASVPLISERPNCAPSRSLRCQTRGAGSRTTEKRRTHAPRRNPPSHRSPPPNPLSTCHDRLPHTWRLEIWCATIQSRRKHLLARPPHFIHSSCLTTRNFGHRTLPRTFGLEKLRVRLSALGTQHGCVSFLSSFRRCHFCHFDGCPIHPTSHPRAIVSGIPPNSAAVSVNELQYEPMSRCVRDKTKRSTTAASIPSRVARVGSPA